MASGFACVFVVLQCSLSGAPPSTDLIHSESPLDSLVATAVQYIGATEVAATSPSPLVTAEVVPPVDVEGRKQNNKDTETPVDQSRIQVVGGTATLAKKGDAGHETDEKMESTSRQVFVTIQSTWI